jgi:diguanylate cyclase (GGDEF)-like protein/PAS domain S-box-containing protein
MRVATISARLLALLGRGRQTLAWVAGLSGTIRGRILVAFLVMSVIAGALGGYSALGIRRAGVLVAKTFDESLMSINYARAASADFAAMEAAFARRWTTSDPAKRDELDQTVERLVHSLDEDLTIAGERSQSTRAAQSAEKVRTAVAAWSEVRRNMARGPNREAAWEKLDRYAAIVDQEIDMLINYTAGDGFSYRQSARRVVATDTQLNLVGTGLALLLSGLVAWLLARRIIGPVAVASAVAERIAGGELYGVIPQGSADELGALLAAMRVMRNNIRTMMEREVAQRRSAQARLADALENSREGVVVVDSEGRIALTNSQIADFFGGCVELLREGMPVAELAAFLTDSEGKSSLLRLDAKGPAINEAQLRDGRWLRVSQSATQEGGFIAVCSDITVLKDQEARLKATNLRLDAALDNMSQGLCLFDAHNRLEVVNRRFCEIFRLSPERVQPGTSFGTIIELSIVAGNHPGKNAADVVAEETSFSKQTSTHFQELSEGRVIAISNRPMTDGRWVATYEDVTERLRSEAQIVYMARHDALTGLPNRVLFAEKIEQAALLIGRGKGFAVLCLDLDRFKHVNDTLGHALGDELLRSVAARLRSCVRQVDTVARLGGDEFAVVQAAAQPDEAAILARRIVEVISAPYDIEGNRVTVGASVGITMAPADGSTHQKLLKNADVALYRAKAEGRGTWRFFEAEMDARLQARRSLELDLHAALANDEFELFYQPQFDLRRDRVSEFEALLRWRHPTRGLVSPAEFIPIAEEIGLIVPLGEWVVRHACAEATSWPGHVKVAVNVSAAQFKSSDLVQIVTDSLTESGLLAQRLELEITESVLLADGAATLATLHALRDLGVRISMDDFGTGYSSLSYLRSFPFDKIKIDKSFVKDLSDSNDSGAIVRAIISLGRSLGMRTAAEGVETREQLTWLRREGCDEVQGYFFSAPTCSRDISELLKRLSTADRAVA